MDEKINPIEGTFSEAVITTALEAQKNISVEGFAPTSGVIANINIKSDTVVQYILKTPEIFLIGKYRLVVLGDNFGGGIAITAKDDNSRLDGNYDGTEGG